MEFKTHNEKLINCGGTSLVGEIKADYSDLKRVFGKPHGSDGCKSDAEWEVEFSNGVVATIYNWKNGKNYLGKHGIAKTKITDWHIGGKTDEAVSLVKKALSK
jgi:hypothetical protein